MIYVTPYDLKTKKCLAASTPAKVETLEQAEAAHMQPGFKRISKGRKLLLIDCAGGGLAFSDYRIRHEQ